MLYYQESRYPLSINKPIQDLQDLLHSCFVEDNSIILSLTVIFSVLTVTTVPVTIKSPVKLRFLY